METTFSTPQPPPPPPPPPSSQPLMVSIADSQPTSPSRSPDTGQMRSSSPFTPNSFPIHKSSLMSSSSPPAAATAGSPIPNDNSPPTTRLSPSSKDQPIAPQTASIRDGATSVTSSLSDVETFNGKIVYNPDGSAYIIEGPDSDGSEVEAEISQEGSIIDARGLSPNYGTISFPQIVSAFHISRSNDYYSTLCGSNATHSSANDSKAEMPVMHSYRVFSLRDSSVEGFETKSENGLDDDDESRIRAANCSSVPVKPILMCFICKLSFGYTKSFVAHAVGEHHLTLNDDESRALSSKNTSAIIQGVGKNKEPLLSFLKPKSSPAPFCTPSQAQFDAQRLLAAQMAAVASAFRSNSFPGNQTNSEKLLSPDPVQSQNSPNSVNGADESGGSLASTAKAADTSDEFKMDTDADRISASPPPAETDSGRATSSPSKQQSPNESASQFASELADLANLEKFAKAAAAAAQQQQMDLHSIAAAMAAAVAASTSNSGQNRTPSPGNKSGGSPPKTSTPVSQGQLLINSGQLNNANYSAAVNNLLNNSDCKSAMSSIFNTGSDSETPSSLLATVANHVTRSTLTSSHPPLLMQHSRNSCKTLKCPKCNWHYKYQETLEIHMKEKHPENEMNCIYCLTNQPHPRLARGETYTCGYKPYRCDVCNYSTTTKGNLSIHMQSDKHINNVQELQNGNIPATAEHLLQSQALAAAVAQASAAAQAAANGSSGGSQSTASTTNVPTSTTGNLVSSNSGSPVPTSTAVNLAAIAAAAAAQQDAKNQLQKLSQPNSASSTPTPSTTPNSTKQKATWRCDVCNYETNVARNLRIHMTSEKHTHNIMVLKQNVTQMQQLSAIQQGIISPEQLLQFNPGLFAAAAAAAGMNSQGNDNGSAVQPEVALADIAYNHALLMMASQQQQRTMAAIMHQQQQQQQQQASNSESKSPMLTNGSQPTFDIDHPDPSLSGNPAPYDDSCRLYHCCVCGTFTSDSIETLSQHIQCDRTRTREDEVLMSVGGSYICKLCTYKTNLKANFQLHCKTDKHLQRLQHVNHIKEGGPNTEWKLNFINVSNPVQVRCNVCDYYTNSIHKLQLHTANPRHDICSKIFNHLQVSDLAGSSKYYYCTLCSSATRTKIALIQHLNSVKHLRNESLRQLKQQQSGSKDTEDEIREMFQVKELTSGEKITFENDDDNGLNTINSPPLTGATLESSADAMLLKNALIEQAAASQLEAKLSGLAESDSHHRSTPNTLNCPFCSFTNTSELRMQMHLLTAHQQSANEQTTSSPSILCPLCQEAFQEKSRLENHLVEVHNVTKEGVKRLMLLVDTTELDKFLAKKEETSGEDEDRRSDSGDSTSKLTEEEMIESNQMIASGNASNAMLEHLLCPICNRMFVNLDELFSHQSTESHLLTNAGQFHCWRPGCGKSFKTATTTQQHFKEHHFLKCFKLSTSSANLASNASISDRHVYKYRCSQCSLAFKTFEKLQLHSQYHLIRAATQCVICSRSFRSVESLQKHVDTAHSDMNEEELEQYKTSLMNNQLLFALGRNGGILDPATTELLKKESSRGDDEEMEAEEESQENSKEEEAMDTSDVAAAENGTGFTLNGNVSENSLEDYLNSQSLAEDNYNDPNRKFKCHRCKVAFTRQSYLTSHNKTLLHRKGEKMSYPMEKYLDPNRPFKCEICKESFTQKNILLVHYNSVSHLHRLKQSMKESSAAVAAVVAATSANLDQIPSEPENDGENKPFRCNLCKVSYSMATSLHTHLRSQLHLTRTSKLHELAQSGQLDLSLPLIEPLNTLETNNNNPAKVNANEQNCKSTSSPVSTPNKLPDMLANFTEQQQQALAFQQAALNFALATGQSANSAQSQLLQQMTGQSPFTCVKCGAAFISQDAQLQHQQLCGLFGAVPNPLLPSQAKQLKLQNFQAPLCKSKPQLYKHLLETWGFEIVMQFNESHQKKKKLTPPELKPETATTTAAVEEEPVEKAEEAVAETSTEEKAALPEINRCQCDICGKEFSSIWVLKAHREEIHKDVLPLDVVESFADEYRTEYDKKFSNGNDEETNDSGTNENNNQNNESNSPAQQQSQNQPSPPNPPSNPTPTPNANPAEQFQQQFNNLNAATNAQGLAQFLPNLPANASAAEIAANQMAAAQLQFGQILMQMGLAGMAAGIPMQAGMNMPFAAAAAMGIPPQLLPVMMADPMMAAAAAFNNPALAAAAAAQMNQQAQVATPNSAPGTPSPAPTTPSIVPPQVPTLNTQAVVAAASAAQQQKRARTRISDEQLKVLRQYFDINNSPTEEQLIEMSHKSGLPMKVIKHWFRNTLFKERQRNKDSPYNFNNPPSTFLNLDEYEKTGETKVFTLEEIKKNESAEAEKEKPKDKPESESEAEKNGPTDFKSSSSTKDTDYGTSDDEELKRRESKELHSALLQNDITTQLQKQAHFQAQIQQHAQEFDQLSKAMALNINSPQPSESSMSSNSESTATTNTTTTSNLFANLANFGTGLSTAPALNSSPLQFALDAAQRSQLAAAAAAAANTPTMMANSTGSTHSSSGKRANRTRFTDYQIKVLQEFFESNAYPKDDDLEYLSKLLNLSPRVIVVWFQNARQKARKVYENQPPSTPIGEDDGSGRFQRTPGLNYQCKKCLQVFQRYYELIKHQKSSCFKDENPLAAQIRMAAEARAQATSPATSRDAPSTPMDCSRSGTATPEKAPINMLTSPGSGASPSPSSVLNNKSSPVTNNESQTFRCDKCSAIFNRLDLWRDHQIVHIVNTNLFNAASAANPFGLMQLDSQAQSLPATSPQPTVSPNPIYNQGTKRKVTTDDEDDDHSHDFDSMSGNGGSNSGDPTPRDKRLRTTILPEQLDYLYQKYQVESNPSRKMLESIAKEVGLKKRVVQVWFQNTRARERKGQFRAHQQVIHKRCPFCRALFKARSALESHLATRHADQYTKGDINIDALPDGDPSEDGDSQVNDNNLDNSQMADVMKRYYEDSFKKYLDELNIQGKDGGQLPAELSLKMKSELLHQKSSSSSSFTNTTILSPLDLSHSLTPISSQLPPPPPPPPPLPNNRHNHHNGEDEGFDDTRSEEFDSDMEEEIDYDYSQSLDPSSPKVASKHQSPAANHRGGGNKRFRTQMTTVMLKVMKSIFADYKTPTMAECESLGREIGLPKRVVQVWFQNARAKEKKARIAFAKTFGQEIDANNPTSIDECKICNVRYNYKLSSNAMQEHLFSKSHLDHLKIQIDSVKKMIEGQDENSADFPVASGHPIPATMLVNPHSTSSIFNSVSNADPSKTASFLQQLQLIQGLAASAGANQLPLNIADLLNGANSNSSMNGGEQQQAGSQPEEPEPNHHFNDNSSNLSSNNFRHFMYATQDGQ